MKNAIMESPHQLCTYGRTVTIEDLRKGSYYEGIFYGRRMHTHDIGNVYHDIETWNYPNKQIEKKLKIINNIKCGHIIMMLQTQWIYPVHIQ